MLFCFCSCFCLLLFLFWGVSITHPLLTSFLCGEFLLLIPFCLHFYTTRLSYTSRVGFVFCLFVYFNLGSFSYTSHVGFTFLWGVSRTHPLLTSFLCREFLLQIPFCLHFCLHFRFYLGSFSYISRATFFFFFFLWLFF